MYSPLFIPTHVQQGARKAEPEGPTAYASDVIDAPDSAVDQPEARPHAVSGEVEAAAPSAPNCTRTEYTIPDCPVSS